MNKIIKSARIFVIFAAGAAALILSLSACDAGVSKYPPANGILVFQSDFGLKDGAVSAMKGVAMGVSKDIKIFDITHEIPPEEIWDAAYRLHQTVMYWPKGTVFVSVVDPGVGSDRKSVVALLKSGHYIVTPDNGTLTLAADNIGISEIRTIDEQINRLPGSSDSYTFHGRDVYAYTGARLASGKMKYSQTGPSAGASAEMLHYSRPYEKDGVIHGCIDMSDVQYGNLWTNINRDYAKKLGIAKGNQYRTEIFFNGQRKYSGVITFGNTFSDVPEGEPVMYLNSLGNLSLAINMGSFAARHGISYGHDWQISVSEK